MILLDSNIFIYAAGAPDPHKQPSATLLARVARDEIDAAIDAEVLQEILHRYRAIHRWSEGRRVYDLTRRIVPTVLDIRATTLDRARALLDELDGLTARDAVHAAVCQEAGAEAICTYDRHFDRIPGLTRLEPDEF